MKKLVASASIFVIVLAWLLIPICASELPTQLATPTESENSVSSASGWASELVKQMPIILPSLTTIVAITVPLITTAMNNKHQQKMKLLDVQYDAKKEAYLNFISSFPLTLDPSDAEREAFVLAGFKAVLFSDKKHLPAITEYMKKIRYGNFSSYESWIFSHQACAALLAEDLNSGGEGKREKNRPKAVTKKHKK